jgi:hypothetical protein
LNRTKKRQKRTDYLSSTSRQKGRRREQTAVTDVNATDADLQAPSYSISGGPDAARFAIEPATGVLSFVAAPNFEASTPLRSTPPGGSISRRSATSP